MAVTTRALIALSIVPALAAQQSDAAWQRGAQSRTGSALQVHLRSGDVRKGSLVQWDADRLTLRRAGKPETFDRGQVTRVTKRSRAKGALVGFLVGFGIAAPIGAYAGPYIADIGNPRAGTRFAHAMGWGLFFGGASAGIGAALGMQSTVYRAGP